MKSIAKISKTLQEALVDLSSEQLKAGCEQEFLFCFLKKTKACTSKCEENFGFMVNMGNLVIQCKIFVN